MVEHYLPSLHNIHVVTFNAPVKRGTFAEGLCSACRIEPTRTSPSIIHIRGLPRCLIGVMHDEVAFLPMRSLPISRPTNSRALSPLIRMMPKAILGYY